MSLAEFENSGECARMNRLKFNAFQRAVLGKVRSLVVQRGKVFFVVGKQRLYQSLLAMSD